MGDGFPTGSTPGRPKVEEDHLPFELGKNDLLSIEGFKSKIRCHPGRGFLFFTTMGEKEYPYET
jgi:hypothetical protein